MFEEKELFALNRGLRALRDLGMDEEVHSIRRSMRTAIAINGINLEKKSKVKTILRAMLVNMADEHDFASSFDTIDAAIQKLNDPEWDIQPLMYPLPYWMRGSFAVITQTMRLQLEETDILRSFLFGS